MLSTEIDKLPVRTNQTMISFTANTHYKSTDLQY